MDKRAEALLRIADESYTGVKERPSDAGNLIKDSQGKLAEQVERIKALPEDDPIRPALMEVAGEVKAYLTTSADWAGQSPYQLIAQMDGSRALIREVAGQLKALQEIE